MEKVFLNGQITDADKASVPITDSSYLYGIGLFETMRAAGGRVFRLADHLERLAGSAARLGIVNRFSNDQIAAAIDQTLKANALTDARLRLELSNGPLDSNGAPSCHLLITAAAFTPYPADYYAKGIRVILTDFRQNPKDPYCGHKTTCYGPRLTALKNAHEKLAAEALWFTTENTLAEGCVSNVFLVRQGILYTPPLTTPVLPGIGRKTVLEIAKGHHISCVEQPLGINDLLGADEVFLTNVIMEVMPVTAVEAHTVGDGKPGPVTRKLSASYKDILSLK
ncbi:MAG TPA: aminotransferase class IV [Anaerohalosphaeraceae bacterium]|nr:aminotransferase class IV family protein [Phycisphaerae bacterium]HOK95736.1 aminotransferase class IV [Anaerohalosphaeraceae bacterium]HOL31143.1 aminotransferase class IV [Anaerohalosphaeraceae bacterium]HOM76484.1 aminotransferase class IV [Anaerohalosphaeraceae bacterium]HPC64628.1 aminotransferase class IV [Anaerohalosphaeraceae bacterium]